MILEKVSVSQIASFDPTQPAGCPRRWWFRYVAGKPEPETASKSKGKDFHTSIEHYLKTGEDVLSPEVRAGKHLIRRGEKQYVEVQVPDRVFRLKLDFAGVYLSGRIDLLDCGTVHLDGEGAEVSEDVIEVLDWKTTSSIAAYGKSGAALLTDPQMVGYGLAVLNADRHADRVRLSHVYFQTRGQKLATKRTIVATRDHLEGEHRRLTAVVSDMQRVAEISDASEVPKNLLACSAYGGCPHASYCPKSKVELLKNIWRTPMSLRRATPAPQTQVPPAQQPAPVAPSAQAVHTAPVQPAAPPAQAVHTAPVQPAATHRPVRAEVAAKLREEIERSDDEEGCADCGEELTIRNVSRLVDGTIKHIGCKGAPPQITPPDQPVITLAQSFEPVPPESIQTLPAAARELAAQNVEPRRETSKSEAQGAAEAPKRGRGRPRKTAPEPESQPGSPPAAVEQRTERAAVQEAGHTRTDIRPALQAHESRDLAQSEQHELPATVPEHTILIVDALVETCEMVYDLGPEVDALAEQLARQHNAADLRCAPADSPLSFGKWKGALTAVLRAEFTPRRYQVGNASLCGLRCLGDEVREVAAQAIASKFTTVVWGRR